MRSSRIIGKQTLSSFDSRPGTLLWPAIFLTLVVYGMTLIPGGYLHYEGQFFLTAQLDGRDVIQRLFSAHSNEWDCYQGRELSFAASLLDAQFVALGARFGAPHLYSVTTCLAVFGSAVLLQRLLPRLAAGLDGLTVGLIVSLFVTTPVAALSGYYYRPAKALTALLFIVVVLIICSISRAGYERASRRELSGLAIAATMMGLADRVGVFLIIATGIVLLILEWPLRRRHAWVFGCLGAALLLNVAWSGAVGPMLAEWADNIRPDTKNQRVPLRFTFGNFVHYKAAMSLWVNQLGFYFGNSGAGGGTVAVVAGVAALSGIPGRKNFYSPKGRVLVAAGAAALMALALYTAMYAKLSSLVWPESQRVYYWLPGVVGIAMITAVATAAIISRWPQSRNFVRALLVSILVANVVALPGHRDAVLAGEQRPQLLEAPRVRDCMRSARDPVSSAQISPAARLACYNVRLAAFGTGGSGGRPPAVAPNPLLYCRGAQKSQPAFRSLGP